MPATVWHSIEVISIQRKLGADWGGQAREISRWWSYRDSLRFNQLHQQKIPQILVDGSNQPPTGGILMFIAKDKTKFLGPLIPDPESIGIFRPTWQSLSPIWPGDDQVTDSRRCRSSHSASQNRLLAPQHIGCSHLWRKVSRSAVSPNKTYQDLPIACTWDAVEVIKEIYIYIYYNYILYYIYILYIILYIYISALTMVPNDNSWDDPRSTDSPQDWTMNYCPRKSRLK